MTVRLRDSVTLLEPATTTDPYTDEALPDWTQPPTEHPDAPAYVRPVSSSEQVLTSSTVISRWQGFLGPEWDGVVTSAWRVRWDGDDYEVDGAVERHKKGACVRFLTLLLKHVD